MTSTHRIPAADASVLPAVRGLRSWAAILLAVVVTVIGMALDGATSGVLAWGLRIGFVAGCVLAALAVRRAAIFTAMVQPPLLLALAVVVGTKLFTDVSGMTAIALKVVSSFPTMAVGTGLAVVIGLIRIIAQPLRKSRKPAAPAATRSYA